MLYDIDKLPRRKRFHSPYIDGSLGTNIMDYPYKDDKVSLPGSYPAVNIIEYDKDYAIELAAPGLCKKDYEITVQKDTLKITTVKKIEDNINGRFSRREFINSEFEKAFILPDNADAEAIAATCNNGILNIHIPKKIIESRPKARNIAIT